MRWLGLLFSLAPVATLGSNFNGLARRNVTAPDIPDRQPFGFASTVTGGGNPSPNNTFVVENMMDLREALEMTTPRTIYVRGEIKGNQINETTFGDCQMYIDESPVPEFNFTQYIMSYNDTYMNAVEAAADADEEFDGMNATEYLNVLKRQNVCTPFLVTALSTISLSSNNTITGMERPCPRHPEDPGVDRRTRERDSNRHGLDRLPQRREPQFQQPFEYHYP